MRAQEFGLINRVSKIYVTQKPKCESSSVVHPVAINGVLPAFIFLCSKYSLFQLNFFELTFC